MQGFHNLRSKLLYALYIHIAQLDRAFGYEPKGRGFKSLCGYGSTTYIVLRYGSVVEMADTLDLGSSAQGRAGSTPARATKGAFTRPNRTPIAQLGE